MSEMRAYVRSIAVSSHHQVGTARMGVDSGAVSTGNTNAAALIIGERAADFILGKAAAR